MFQNKSFVLKNPLLDGSDFKDSRSDFKFPQSNTLARLFPFSRFRVVDNSMLPTFSPGERVLCFNWAKINVGDPVVFKLDFNYLKRVERIENGLLFISGDNQKISARLGPITKKEIIGKVILKY